MFAEVSGAETEVCNLIQLCARACSAGIPSLWHRDDRRRDGTIVKGSHSGADDLLARPFSTQVMGERIKAQVERRKGFVDRICGPAAGATQPARLPCMKCQFASPNH
jgi:DNA-binding response OmpR family regulator